MSIKPQSEPGLENNQSAENFSKKKLAELDASSFSAFPNSHNKQEEKESFVTKLMEKQVAHNFSIFFQILITLITIISLFMEDLRVIFFQKESDKTIDAVNIAFIVIFSAEIFMSLTISGYFCSFFFYLDILSTCSIMMDISMLTDLLYTSNGSDSFQLNILITQSKASRAAARTVRVMKIFRLTRVVKLYKSALRTKELKAVSQKEKRKQELKQIQLNKMKEALKMEEKENESKSASMRSMKMKITHMRPDKVEVLDQIKQNSNEESGENQSLSVKDLLDEEEGIEKINKNQSKIGKLLSESTIKKVIIVILFLMFSVPVFDIDNYYPDSTSWDFLVSFVGKIIHKSDVPLDKVNEAIEKNIESAGNLEVYSKLIIFETPFGELPSYNLQKLENLRINDIGIAEYEVQPNEIVAKRSDLTLNGNDNFITVIINYREFNRLDSIFSIVKIIFICLIIMYLLNSFNDHTSELIIDPIERMVEEIKMKGESSEMDDEKEEKVHNTNYENYETTNVHKAITKISGLMMKVFGSIAFETLYKKIFNSGNIIENYLQESKYQFFIFGLCTICQYQELSTILRDQIFQLSNDVVKYLHSAAFRYGGTGVVNYGKSFLIVFSVPSVKEKESKSTQNSLNIMADFSVYAFVKTMVKINKEHQFLRYRKDPRLLSRMGENFQLKLSCVLHAGWAYEGLMGSAYKMDPTYIGKPLIELESISNFCQFYPNNLFMTSEIQKILTTDLKKLTRIVDAFEVEGMASQNELFLIDMDLQNISPPKSSLEKRILGKDKHGIHLKRELNLEYVKNEITMKNYHALLFINSKKELREVLKNVLRDDYRKKYTIIYEQYESGKWQECKENLEDIFLQNKEDILSQRIYDLIENFSFNRTTDRQVIKCRKKYNFIE